MKNSRRNRDASKRKADKRKSGKPVWSKYARKTRPIERKES